MFSKGFTDNYLGPFGSLIRGGWDNIVANVCVLNHKNTKMYQMAQG